MLTFMKVRGGSHSLWPEVLLLGVFMLAVYPIAILSVIITSGDVLSFGMTVHHLRTHNSGAVVISVLTWLALPLPWIWIVSLIARWPERTDR